ncbi:MAG TPA: TfoX/Sxy family protein [Candidatus Thermoplasmatota archaeon]|nr:TfoX/Sxy family protein [Candidatus Thermoplasmatota archaeon]
MGSSPATVEAVLESLGPKRFSAKAMFGEYALYADGKVVALLCDDRLYVKVHDATAALAKECELAPPYPGAKPHYVLDEGEWVARRDLPDLLAKLARALPAQPPKKPRAKERRR